MVLKMRLLFSGMLALLAVLLLTGCINEDNPVRTSLVVDTSTLTLAVGETATRTATSNASDAVITYTSSNPAVATVDQNGKVTAVSEGEATITVDMAKSVKKWYAPKTLTYMVIVKNVSAQTPASADEPTPAPTNTDEPTPQLFLAGVFSVGASTQVQFSRGNLQATTNDLGAHWTWAFAENQWDYIGGRTYGGSETETGNNFINGNGTVSANGTVDLFGWSTTATTYGIYNSSVSGDYSGDFVDWGATMGTGWRTLTKNEWVWILGPEESPSPGTNCRTSSTINGIPNARYTKAKVNGVQGVILFPDTYTHPAGIALPDADGINSTGNAGWENTSYSAADWSKMEAAGCVFLPAAGSRYEALLFETGSFGDYWSNTLCGATNAYSVSFLSGELHPTNYNSLHLGSSVRLVRAAE